MKTDINSHADETVMESYANMENEQTGAGRDGRTRLARPNFHAQTGTGTTSRIGHLYSDDSLSAICDDHTCTYIYT